MNPIEQIKERLRKYPEVKYEADASSIVVLPASSDGFAVGLDVNGSQFTVSFNGWHEDFTTEEEALECFAFGLSDECRLREHRRGNFPYRWAVESKQDGEWVTDSETGLAFFPFWRRTEVVYLRNQLIKSNDEPAT